MNHCEEVKQSLRWFLDEELDALQSVEVQQHVEQCSNCKNELVRLSRLRQVLRKSASNVAAPRSLRLRVQETLELQRPQRSLWGQWWPAMAAASILLSFIWRGGATVSADLDEAAQRHARNLPMEVVASDVSSVQSYFSGKLPFAVHVPRLATQPGQMLGGRLVSLGNREAAYVRYETPQGRVSVFVYEDPNEEIFESSPVYRVGERPVVVKRVRGFTTARWHASGLVYSIVTDLPDNEVPKVLDASLR